MFRQAFLLSQYSFICEQYVKCSEMTKYTQYFLTSGKQTANCFNNILFILVAKISSKKVCEKTNAELLRLVGITFDSKLPFLRKMRKKKLIILKTLPFFVLYVCRCRRLNCQISIESVWKIVISSLNVIKCCI